jgi:hypothetical protein
MARRVMYLRPHLAFCLVLLCILTAADAKCDEFYAYYTKVDHSPTDYVGKYADIVVVLGSGRQLEFTRQTGFLPRWRTPKVAVTLDDFFPSRVKDYALDYNYVRLIKNTPEEIVVHWRYMPDVDVVKEANRQLNPLAIEGITGVVHETFTIHPDGTVKREIRDARGTKYRDWMHPDARTRQIIKLRDEGIEYGPVKWARSGPFERTPVQGNPQKEVEGMPEPRQAWLFDEGLDVQDDPELDEDLVVDSVDEVEAPVEGLMTVYKRGVSGTSLAFDGYYSAVTIAEDQPDISEELTVEAWVALDVFPYNTAAIVHQSRGFGEQGYYLGVDAYGCPIFTVNGTTIHSPNALPLNAWVHVAATAAGGNAKLYVNGRQVASAKCGDRIDPPNVPLIIGRNSEKSRCTDPVRGEDQNLPFLCGVAGLIDEVKIYGQALTSRQINDVYNALKPVDPKSELARGALPGELGIADAFGAMSKTLQFHELWDKRWRMADDADIVVKFDANPCSVIFWRGTNYGASWVTDNNRWMSDQSSEIFTKHGCSEHMADKQLRHCHARIIENSPARVVVHWRYPCVDVSYLCTNQRHWSDEYYTIYPDGTGVRKVVWNKGYDPPGFQDIQFLTNPGETALDVMNLQAVTVANVDGEVREMTWRKPNRVPRNTLPGSCVAMFNSKSQYRVFAIFQGNGIGPWGRDEQSPYTDDPFAGPWNHWPVHLVPSDGRFAVATDRVTHFALGGSDAEEFGSMVLYGVTAQPITSLVPLAKMWRSPPPVTAVEGAISQGFDKDQRAFVFTDCRAGAISLTLDASDDSPIVNPCLVLKNWGGDEEAELIVNEQRIVPSKNFRQGNVHDGDGLQAKVIWFEWNSNKATNLQIRKVNRQQLQP